MLGAALAAAAVGLAGGALESVTVALTHGYYFHTVRSFATFVLVPGGLYAAAGLALGALVGWLLTIIRRSHSPVPVVTGAAAFVVVAVVVAATIEDAELPRRSAVAWGASGLGGAIIAGGLAWLVVHRDRRLIRFVTVLVLGAGLLATATGAWLFGPGGSGATPYEIYLVDSPRSVLLVTIDTLRADRVGCYTSGRSPLTPTLDALAREGAVFENAIVPMVVTDPSHASILTGLYPAEHGVVRNAVPLDPGVVTVAELFLAAGFRTGASVSVEHMDAHPSGLSQGFEVYFDRGPHDRFRYHAGWKMMPRPRKNRLFAHERPATSANRDAFRFLDAVGDEPFFLWVHYFEPHTPYVGRDGTIFDEEARALLETEAAAGKAGERAGEVSRLYDDEVRRADEALGELLAGLEERGLSDSTLILVTSDHGEHMAEERLGHGLWFGHSDVYDEACRVPLVVRPAGGIPPQVIPEQVSTMDVAEGLLEGAGVMVDWPPGSLEGDGTGLTVEPVVVLPNPHMPIEGTALRSGRWKLIVRPGGVRELYDLVSDPNEISNIVAISAVLADSLERALTGIVSEWTPRETPDAPDALTREMLRSLGYVD